LKVNRRFGGKCCLQLQGRGMSQARNHRESRWQPWRWRQHVPPKRRLTINGLHGVISQKIELFISLMWEPQILHMADSVEFVRKQRQVIKAGFPCSTGWGPNLCAKRSSLFLGIVVIGSRTVPASSVRTDALRLRPFERISQTLPVPSDWLTRLFDNPVVCVSRLGSTNRKPSTTHSFSTATQAPPEKLSHPMIFVSFRSLSFHIRVNNWSQHFFACLTSMRTRSSCSLVRTHDHQDSNPKFHISNKRNRV
jgi:hypothetical protein